MGFLQGQPQASRLSAMAYSDVRRASLDGQWRTQLTLQNGMRLEPFAQARGDVYSIGGSQIFNIAAGTLSPGASSVSRGYGTIGANLSWPFIRQSGRTDIILEPIAQLAISPNVRPNVRIPNEESVSFEYDETNLFSINRFPGADLYEGGQRLNVGGRATFDWGGNRNASFLVGRTFRAERDPVFTPASGLQGRASDWIVSATVYPYDGLSFFDRARLDSETLNVRRQEAGFTFLRPRFAVGAHYLYNESGVTVSPTGQVGIGRVQTADAGGSVFLTRHWGLGFNVTRDLQAQIWPVAQLGLFYQDECLRLDVIYTHDETYNRLIGDSNSIAVRLTLATLGGVDPGFGRYRSGGGR
jgi:LPS-assembly protein